MLKKSMFKKVAATVLAGCMILGSTVGVMAETGAAHQKVTVSDIFDAEDYADKYDDLEAAFGDDEAALLDHYLTYGIVEGRDGQEFIDLAKYRANNADLEAAFGDDWDAYLNHYVTYGIYEGRYSFSDFDAFAYMRRYADLREAYGYDPIALYNHYVEHGKAEHRIATTNLPVVVSSSDSSNNSGNTSGTTNDSTAPATVQGSVVDPETGAPLANATVQARPAGYTNPVNNAAIVLREVEVVTLDDAAPEDETPEGDDTTPGGETPEGDDTTPGNETPEGDDTTPGNETPEGGDTTPGDDTTDGGETIPGGETTEGDTTPGETVVEDGVYTTTTDANGSFSLTDVLPGTYTLTVTADGYMTLTIGSFTVTGGETNYTERVQVLSESADGTNGVAGEVKDATTGIGMDAVEVSFRSGWNNSTGAVVESCITNEVGRYESVLERGYYTATFTKAGFIPVVMNVVSLTGYDSHLQNVSISPEMTDDVEYRIVLTWGETPSDLDSHLTGPVEGSEERFHVYFGSKSYYDANGEVIAELDVDDVTSYGPETVTVVRVSNTGVYRYSVHDFTNGNSTNSTALSNSGATVKLYRGAELVRTYQVPSNVIATEWNVFEINNGELINLNRMSNDYSSLLIY